MRRGTSMTRGGLHGDVDPIEDSSPSPPVDHDLLRGNQMEQYVVFKYRLTDLYKLAGGDGHQRDLAGRSSGLHADARGDLVHGGYGEAKRFFLLVKTGSSRSGSPRRHGWPYVPFPQQQAPRTARVNTPRLAHNATPLSFSLFDEARCDFPNGSAPHMHHPGANHLVLALMAEALAIYRRAGANFTEGKG